MIDFVKESSSLVPSFGCSELVVRAAPGNPRRLFSLRIGPPNKSEKSQYIQNSWQVLVSLRRVPLQEGLQMPALSTKSRISLLESQP